MLKALEAPFRQLCINRGIDVPEFPMQQLLAKATVPTSAERYSACGKIILLGEHAVVYGRPAIALPIPLAVEASVQPGVGDGVNTVTPRWGLDQQVHQASQGLGGVLASIFTQLNI